MSLTAARVLLLAALALAFSACGGGGGGGGGGSSTTTGLHHSVATTMSVEPPGNHCTYGGIRVDTGIDENGNGLLDPAEVDETQYVCNGAPGSGGSNALVRISDEPIGANCPLGGLKIESGLDSNSSGVLDNNEVTRTDYLCAGGLAGALYVMNSNGSLYTLDPTTAAASHLVDLLYDSCSDSCSDPFTFVGAMAFDAGSRTMIAGSDSGSADPGSVFAVNAGAGVAMAILHGSGNGYNHIADMAVGSDHTVYAVVEGVEVPPTLVTLDPLTGAITPVGALDISGIGGGLTFDDAGTTLYLADGGTLKMIDPADATILSSQDMTFFGFPTQDLCSPDIVSMTSVGRGVAYAIVDNNGGNCDISTRHFLAQIDLATGNVTKVGDVSSGIDGLAFAPIPLPESNRVFLGDDQVSSALPIGFTFNFYGNDYSQFFISSNGFMGFSQGMGDGCCSGAAIPAADSINNIIALAWSDLDPPGAGSIVVETVGTAGSRKLLVDFIGIPFCCGTTPAVTSEAILYEGTNVIEIHTKEMLTPVESTYTQGIENADGTLAAYATFNNGMADVPRVQAAFSLSNDAVRFTPDGAGGYTVSSIPFAPIAP